MNSSGSRIIPILGMHRSGTSVITRGLQVLSLDLGNNLIGPRAEDNERGFWEDREINALNHSLLRKAGSEWYRLDTLDTSIFCNSAFDIKRDFASQLLKRKIRKGRTFAFKDPCTCLLLPFWQEVFVKLRLTPSYVIVVRNPLEVAESLRKRNGFPWMKSLLLWAKHSVAAIQGTQGVERVFVSYDAVLRDPEGELIRIAASLRLPPPGDNPGALKQYTEEFLSVSLRHHAVPEGRLADVQEVPPFVSKLYSLQIALAKDEIPGRGARFTSRWEASKQGYDESLSMMNFIDRINQQKNQVLEAQIRRLKQSGSWRITAPLRFARRIVLTVLKRPYQSFPRLRAEAPRRRRLLPLLSDKIKRTVRHLRHVLFARFSWTFSWSGAHHRWKKKQPHHRILRRHSTGD